MYEKRRFNIEELERECIKEGINEMKEEIKRYYKMSNWRSIKTWNEVFSFTNFPENSSLSSLRSDKFIVELNLITNVLKYNGIETIKVDRKRKEINIKIIENTMNLSERS